MCDTKLSLLLCRAALQRRHLPFCRQYPTETGVAGNGGVGSSRNNVASAARLAIPDASPERDSQQQGGREPGWCGMVNPGEALLNVVMSNKRKLLNRLGQKGTWSGPSVIQSLGADAEPPAKRRGLTHTATATERGKPVASPTGRRTARDADGAAGKGRGRKRMPACNGPDKGCDLTLRASGQTSLGCWRTRTVSQPAQAVLQICRRGRKAP